MLNLDFNFDANRFVTQVIESLSESNVSLHVVFSKALVSEIKKSIENSFTSEQLVKLKIDEDSLVATHSISEAIASGGYPFRNIKVQIDLKSGCKIFEFDINKINGFDIKPIHYYDESKKLKFKYKRMKTRERYIVVLLHVVIPVSTLTVIKSRFEEDCKCSNNLLRPVKHRVWEWVQQFGCVNCGKRYLCNCFKTAIQMKVEEAQVQKTNYSSSGWPHRLLESVSTSEFRKNICHLCTGTPSSLLFCHPMYGSPIRVKYGAYMKKFEIEENLSERDAENKVREILGVPKIGEGWINETQLFKIVEYLFSDYEVIREASPKWLGNQRLDIYIPNLNLAIEYQGEQHYKPVSLFGGEEGFKKTQERDKMKQKLCQKNGVKVVYFSYKENITQPKVEKKLLRELSSAKKIYEFET